MTDPLQSFECFSWEASKPSRTGSVRAYNPDTKRYAYGDQAKKLLAAAKKVAAPKIKPNPPKAVAKIVAPALKEKWVDKSVQTFIRSRPKGHVRHLGGTDELVRVGEQALVSAAKTWKPARGASFKTYQHLVVRNALKNWWDKEFRHTLPAAPSTVTDRAATAEPEPDPKLAHLPDAIQKLPAKDREVIHRLYWQDQTPTQVAKALGVSREYIRQLRERAHAAIKEHLEKKTADASPLRKYADMPEQINDKSGFRTCKGVEIFAAGVHRDKPYPPEKLHEVVENFNRLSVGDDAVLKPPLVIGHEEQQDLLENTGIPAAGWVSQIYLSDDGQKLLGDFEDVAPQIATLIDEKRYRKVSAELYDDFTDQGKHFGCTLRRVALLGGEIPQVKSLADIPHTQEQFSDAGGTFTRIISSVGPYRGADGRWYWNGLRKFAEVRKFDDLVQHDGPAPGVPDVRKMKPLPAHARATTAEFHGRPATKAAPAVKPPKPVAPAAPKPPAPKPMPAAAQVTPPPAKAPTPAATKKPTRRELRNQANELLGVKPKTPTVKPPAVATAAPAGRPTDWSPPPATETPAAPPTPKLKVKPPATPNIADANYHLRDRGGLAKNHPLAAMPRGLPERVTGKESVPAASKPMPAQKPIGRLPPAQPPKPMGRIKQAIYDAGGDSSFPAHQHELVTKPAGAIAGAVQRHIVQPIKAGLGRLGRVATAPLRAIHAGVAARNDTLGKLGQATKPGRGSKQEVLDKIAKIPSSGDAKPNLRRPPGSDAKSVKPGKTMSRIQQIKDYLKARKARNAPPNSTDIPQYPGSLTAQAGSVNPPDAAPHGAPGALQTLFGKKAPAHAPRQQPTVSPPLNLMQRGAPPAQPAEAQQPGKTNLRRPPGSISKSLRPGRTMQQVAQLRAAIKDRKARVPAAAPEEIPTAPLEKPARAFQGNVQPAPGAANALRPRAVNSPYPPSTNRPAFQNAKHTLPPPSANEVNPPAGEHPLRTEARTAIAKRASDADSKKAFGRIASQEESATPQRSAAGLATSTARLAGKMRQNASAARSNQLVQKAAAGIAPPQSTGGAAAPVDPRHYAPLKPLPDIKKQTPLEPAPRTPWVDPGGAGPQGARPAWLTGKTEAPAAADAAGVGNTRTIEPEEAERAKAARGAADAGRQAGSRAAQQHPRGLPERVKLRKTIGLLPQGGAAAHAKATVANRQQNAIARRKLEQRKAARPKSQATDQGFPTAPRATGTPPAAAQPVAKPMPMRSAARRTSPPAAQPAQVTTPAPATAQFHPGSAAAARASATPTASAPAAAPTAHKDAIARYKAAIAKGRASQALVNAGKGNRDEHNRNVAEAAKAHRDLMAHRATGPGTEHEHSKTMARAAARFNQAQRSGDRAAAQKAKAEFESHRNAINTIRGARRAPVAPPARRENPLLGKPAASPRGNQTQLAPGSTGRVPVARPAPRESQAVSREVAADRQHQASSQEMANASRPSLTPRQRAAVAAARPAQERPAEPNGVRDLAGRLREGAANLGGDLKTVGRQIGQKVRGAYQSATGRTRPATRGSLMRHSEVSKFHAHDVSRENRDHGKFSKTPGSRSHEEEIAHAQTRLAKVHPNDKVGRKALEDKIAHHQAQLGRSGGPRQEPGLIAYHPGINDKIQGAFDALMGKPGKKIHIPAPVQKQPDKNKQKDFHRNAIAAHSRALATIHPDDRGRRRAHAKEIAYHHSRLGSIPSVEVQHLVNPGTNARLEEHVKDLGKAAKAVGATAKHVAVGGYKGAVGTAKLGLGAAKLGVKGAVGVKNLGVGAAKSGLGAGRKLIGHVHRAISEAMKRKTAAPAAPVEPLKNADPNLDSGPDQADWMRKMKAELNARTPKPKPASPTIRVPSAFEMYAPDLDRHAEGPPRPKPAYEYHPGINDHVASAGKELARVGREVSSTVKHVAKGVAGAARLGARAVRAGGRVVGKIAGAVKFGEDDYAEICGNVHKYAAACGEKYDEGMVRRCVEKYAEAYHVSVKPAKRGVTGARAQVGVSMTAKRDGTPKPKPTGIADAAHYTSAKIPAGRGANDLEAKVAAIPHRAKILKFPKKFADTPGRTTICSKPGVEKFDAPMPPPPPPPMSSFSETPFLPFGTHNSRDHSTTSKRLQKPGASDDDRPHAAFAEHHIAATGVTKGGLERYPKGDGTVGYKKPKSRVKQAVSAAAAGAAHGVAKVATVAAPLIGPDAGKHATEAAQHLAAGNKGAAVKSAAKATGSAGSCLPRMALGSGVVDAAKGLHSSVKSGNLHDAAHHRYGLASHTALLAAGINADLYKHLHQKFKRHFHGNDTVAHLLATIGTGAHAVASHTAGAALGVPFVGGAAIAAGTGHAVTPLKTASRLVGHVAGQHAKNEVYRKLLRFKRKALALGKRLLGKPKSPEVQAFAEGVFRVFAEAFAEFDGIGRFSEAETRARVRRGMLFLAAL